MRRPLLAAWAVVVLALVPFVALTGTASAVAATAVGYWSKIAAPGPLAPLLAPPNVADGGIYVAKDPSGPAAVAAIRYPITEPGGGQLVLKVAEASTIQTATLNICPVAAPWEATQNGAFDDQPANACAELMINGSVSDDALSVSFFIPETFPLSNGNLEVFVVAADSSMPFTVAFQAPDDTSFTPSSSGGSSEFPGFEGPGDPGADVGAGSDGDPVDSGSTTGSGSDFAVPPSSGGSFSAPPSTSYDSGAGFAAPDTSTPSPPSTPAVGSAGGGTAAAELAANQDADPNDGTARALAIGTLVAIGAGMFFLSARGTQAPVAIGATAAGARAVARIPAAPAAAVGVTAAAVPRRGVGRFARPRLGPPVRL